MIEQTQHFNCQARIILPDAAFAVTALTTSGKKMSFNLITTLIATLDTTQTHKAILTVIYDC